MKNKFLLAVFLFSLNLEAQVTFQKTYGGTWIDVGLAVLPIDDGGYGIVGYTASFGSGGSDVYFLKVNSNGDTLWSRTFGGPKNDIGYSLQSTYDGGFIIGGNTESFGTSTDMYIIKTTSTGLMQWSCTLGGSGIDDCRSILQIQDSGYVLGGYTTSFGAGHQDCYLAKISKNGSLQWTRAFGGSSTLGETISEIQQTNDSGFVLLGSTSSFGASDFYLIKTDSAGVMLWSKTYGGANAEFGNSIKQCLDGGYIMIGSTSSFGTGGADSDCYVVKTSSNGSLQWSKTFGSWQWDGGEYIQQTSDGGYVFVGETNNSAQSVFFIKADSIGDTLWTRTFGGQQCNSVFQLLSGGFIIAGHCDNVGAGLSDVYLIKADSMGRTGCNEGQIGFTVATPSTVVMSPPTQSSSGGAITNVITMMGSGIIETTLCYTAGISEYNSLGNQIVSYPNPTYGIFEIYTSGDYVENIQLYNLFGKCVYRLGKLPIRENQVHIDISLEPPGVYLLKVNGNDGTYFGKIIKQ